MVKNSDDFSDVFTEYANGSASNVDASHFDERIETKEREYDSYGGDRKLKQDTVNIKCVSCGGNLEYDPESGQMKCINCGSYDVIDADKDFDVNEYDPSIDSRNDWAQETRVFKCVNCGAQTVLDNTEIASECAFCGSPNVVKCENIEGIKPDIVMPFGVKIETIKQNIGIWLKKRRFAPVDFKRKFDLDKLQGIYSSCFYFNADTQSFYSARVGKYYYVTVGSGKNRRTERRIRWYNVKGDFARDYTDVAVEASPHFNQKVLDKLKPFPFDRFVSYDKRFLLGYKADHYDKGLKECWSDAKQIIDRDIDRGIRSRLLRSADVVGELRVNTHYYEKKYKLGLVPIYVGNYKYKEKVYGVYANGVTGKLFAKSPISGLKVALLVIGIVAGFLLICGLVYYLQSIGVLPQMTEAAQSTWRSF